MKGKRKESEQVDEMRPEYDLSKLKFVGRGIYAERYRSGTRVVLDEGEGTENQEKPEDDDLRPEYDFSKMRVVARGPGRKVKAP
jgi:hypothetical protein